MGSGAQKLNDKVFKPIASGFQSMGNKLFGEDGLIADFSDNVEKGTKVEKKKNKLNLGFMGKLGMGTVILGAFLGAVILLYNKFEKFADWVDRFMGWNRPDDEKDNLVETTEEFTEGLEDGDVSKDEIDDYKSETDEQIEKQKEKVEYEEGRETAKLAEDVGQVAVSTMANAPKIQGPVKELISGTKNALVNAKVTASANPNNAAKALTETTKSLLKDSGRTLGGTTMGVLKMTSKGLLPVQALFTVAEIRANLMESDDIEATIEEMWESGKLAKEDYEAAKEALESKRKQDVRKPWWQTGVGALVATGVGIALTATGVGAPLGLAIVATTATAASMATGYGVDAYHQGDEILEAMGLLDTADSANANLDDMIEIQQDTMTKANQILDGNNALNDIDAGNGNGTAISTQTSNVDNSQNISAGGNSSPQDANQRAVNE